MAIRPLLIFCSSHCTAVNIWEAIAYTAPGIIAHQSALKGGEPMKIKDDGKAPGLAVPVLHIAIGGGL